ncbi:MAG: hypothetical protein F4Z25_04405 [Chloroflexi bacterium]|nr:hypothetical protein [Chloroflexota bacterium]
MERTGDEAGLTPGESWRTIQATMEDARSSMYVAGTATILLLWGVIASLGYLAEFALETVASDVREDSPWVSAPLWAILVIGGMAGSAIIGSRAGKRQASGDAVRTAGIRVFFFWLAVAVAAFLIPAAAGLWSADADGVDIARAAIGIVALGHVLFGIMSRPLIAAVGVGIGAAFYVPSYLAGDAALAIAAAATLLVVAVAYASIRKSGVL